MTLVDSGPLVALIDVRDEHHLRCRKALAGLDDSLGTTIAVLTECMYLLAERVGPRQAWRAQEALWNLVLRGEIGIAAHSDQSLARAAVLMRRYQDLPMDFADATIVALAESLNTPSIFTLDRDFLVYRLLGRRRFDIIPAR